MYPQSARGLICAEAGMKHFRACAVHYLRQWCDPNRESRLKDTDRQFVQQFQSRRGVTCEQLARFCFCYAVHRTIPGKDSSHKKYQAFANMLNRHRDAEVTPQFIEDRVEEMRRHYGARFLSAITKAFWMLRQDSVIIYDGYVRRALSLLSSQPGNGDYPRYVDSWLQFSQRPEMSEKLSNALAWLPDSRAARLLAKRDISTSRQIHSWSAEPWFRNRVLDIYLWSAN
jgi:hypothetical protein